MKKILVYSPYWKTKGGGERYALTAACCLKERASVTVGSISASDLRVVGKQLNLSIDGLIPFSAFPILKDRLIYDGIFWLSDGSIPFLPVKKKVIHFQAPFRNVNGKSTLNRLKLFGARVICNSQFTKQFIDREFDISSRVISPPVAVHKFQPMRKENLILSVGRFVTTSQRKRPDILVRAFQTMVDKGLKNWRLAIVGIVEDQEGETIATALRTLARKYPIAIRTNLPHDRLVSLFNRAALYWHAAGYGSDIETHPERAEHFGISTVEAMAAGAVPLAFAGGGQVEIITDDQNGLLWKTPDELIARTTELITDGNRRIKVSQLAIKRAQDFSEDRFCDEIQQLFL